MKEINTKIVIATGGAIIKDKRVLLIQRAPDKKNYPGAWTFPAGKYESTDANLEDGAAREVKEEVGLDFTPISLLGCYKSIVNGVHMEGYTYLGDWSGDIILQESEVSDMKWCSYQEAMDLPMAFNYDQGIEDLYQRGLIK